MNSLQRYTCKATLIGFCLAAASGAYAQVSSINSAIIVPRVFNDIPGAVGNYNNSYPGSITLGESAVSKVGGFADRDVWRFSNDGLTGYQFQGNDYFNASFTLTITGSGTPGIDLEAGWLFSNPSGNFGGDLQSFANAANGVVAQVGGPSYYPFSPAAGGYGASPFLPPAGIPNYIVGTTITEGLNYVVDPNTGMNAFQYSVNGVFALNPNLSNTTYFDLGPGQFIGSAGDVLGGYFQIQNDPNNPNNFGQAVFGDINITSVPEPATLAFLGLGIVPLLLRRRRI